MSNQGSDIGLTVVLLYIFFLCVFFFLFFETCRLSFIRLRQTYEFKALIDLTSANVHVAVRLRVSLAWCLAAVCPCEKEAGGSRAVNIVPTRPSAGR